LSGGQKIWERPWCQEKGFTEADAVRGKQLWGVKKERTERINKSRNGRGADKNARFGVPRRPIIGEEKKRESRDDPVVEGEKIAAKLAHSGGAKDLNGVSEKAVWCTGDEISEKKKEGAAEKTRHERKL